MSRPYRRWLGGDFVYMRKDRGMTPDRVLARSRSIFVILAAFIPERTIYNNRLDNPYASVDALKVLLNEMARKRGLWPVHKTVEGVENADSR